MNARVARGLVWLYPKAWRERYGAEVAALLEAGSGGVLTMANMVWSAFLEWVVPTGGVAMKTDTGFQTLCLRAPWVVFGVAPVGLLAAAYLAACVYLWVGWRLFVASFDTPFGVPLAFGTARHGYFILGKLFYFVAPVLVGWWVGFVAVRYQVKAGWVVLGVCLIAWMGGTARIFASRREFPGWLGPIRMNFGVTPSLRAVAGALPHAGVILGLVLVPYVLLRWLERCRRLA